MTQIACFELPCSSSWQGSVLISVTSFLCVTFWSQVASPTIFFSPTQTLGFSTFFRTLGRGMPNPTIIATGSRSSVPRRKFWGAIIPVLSACSFPLFRHVYICTYVCMYVCMYLYIYLYIRASRFQHTNIHSYIHTYICSCVLRNFVWVLCLVFKKQLGRSQGSRFPV